MEKAMPILLAGVMAVTPISENVSMGWKVVKAAAEVKTNQDSFTYEVLKNGTIEIVGCNQDATIADILKKIDGKKVTSIDRMLLRNVKS